MVACNLVEDAAAAYGENRVNGIGMRPACLRLAESSRTTPPISSPSLAVALVTTALLFRSKMPEPLVIVAAAVVGLVAHHLETTTVC